MVSKSDPPETPAAATADDEPGLLKSPGFVAIIATAMVSMMGVSMISPVLPDIQQSFNVPPGSVGWVVTAYAFPGVFVIPFTGLFSDRYGRKRVLVPLLFLYGIAGSACALAPSFEWLLALRLLSGLGSGSLSSLSLALIGDLYTGRRRVEAVGFRISMATAASGIYPVLAGAIGVFGWQYPFLMFLLALPVGFVAMRVLDDSTGPRSKTSVGEYFAQAWHSMRSRRVAGLISIGPSFHVVTFGVFLTYLPLYMEGSFAATAAIIGVIFAVRVLIGSAAASQVARLRLYISLPGQVVLSFIMQGAGAILIPLCPGLWWLLAPAVLIGIATGIGFPASQSMLVSAAPEHLRAAFTSANGVMTRIGQTAGPLLSGVAFVVASYQGVFYFGALCSFSMIAFFLWSQKGAPVEE